MESARAACSRSGGWAMRANSVGPVGSAETMCSPMRCQVSAAGSGLPVKYRHSRAAFAAAGEVLPGADPAGHRRVAAVRADHQSRGDLPGTAVRRLYHHAGDPFAVAQYADDGAAEVYHRAGLSGALQQHRVEDLAAGTHAGVVGVGHGDVDVVDADADLGQLRDAGVAQLVVDAFGAQVGGAVQDVGGQGRRRQRGPLVHGDAVTGGGQPAGQRRTGDPAADDHDVPVPTHPAPIPHRPRTPAGASARSGDPAGRHR